MHHPDNPASGRVLAKAGFTRTGTTYQTAADGAAVPYTCYALQAPVPHRGVGSLGDQRSRRRLGPDSSILPSRPSTLPS